MTNHETSKRCTKFEVTVANGEMRLCIDDSPISPTTPFVIEDAAIKRIKDEYMELDRAPQERSAEEYRQQEAALGRRLAELLLATPEPAPEHSLARRLHCCLLDNEIENKSTKKNKYVRLMLSFDDAKYTGLPWELTLWEQPWTREAIHFGHDRRIALTRFDCNRSGHDCSRPSVRPKYLFGDDRVLSILHVGADDSDDGDKHYEFTSNFFRAIDEYIPRLHTTSRRFLELGGYYQESEKLTGQRPEFDIVHWRGHGNARILEVPGRGQSANTIYPSTLIDITPGVFLYVMLTCESGDRPTMSNRVERCDELSASCRFSSTLLAAGAPVVLGIYDSVGMTEFEHLPLLYPLLFRGLPLDYCVQSLRRFFALRNADRSRAPFSGWQKLMLHTSSDWYLDGPPAIMPLSYVDDPAPSEAAVHESFDTLLERASRLDVHRRARAQGEPGLVTSVADEPKPS